MHIVLYYFVHSATDRKKRPFFLTIGFAVSTPLLHHNRYYNIVKFQIDLVILASLKNFVDQLHNL